MNEKRQKVEDKCHRHEQVVTMADGHFAGYDIHIMYVHILTE